MSLTSLIRDSTFATLLLAGCTDHGSQPPPLCGTPTAEDQLAQTQNQILSLTLAGGEVYWMDMGGIGRAPTDASSAGTEIVSPPTTPFALGGSITSAGANVYWADGNLPSGSVDRVAMSGGGVVQIASTDEPIGVAVDATNIYWSTFGSSSNPVGTLVEQPIAGGAAVTLATGLATVGPIALDDGHVYWSDMFGAVSSVPIAGGAVRTLVPAQYTLPPNTELDDAPVGIAVADGTVYWTSTPLQGATPNVISSVSVDGGAVSVVATPATQLSGLAVDDQFVYWSEIGVVTPGDGLEAPPVANQGSISRIARDGSSAAQLLATGATYPVGPVVGDNAIYYASGSSLSTVYRVVM